MIPLMGNHTFFGSKFYASPDRADNIDHAFRNLSLHMAHALD